MHKKFKIFTIMSMLGFLISSASVLLTPWTYSFDQYKGSKTLSLVSGITFWAGLLIGILFIILAAKQRKKIPKRIKGLPGILNFFRNVESIIADVFVVAAVVLYLLIHNEYVQVVCMFAFIAGIYFHCIFNGLIYRTFKELNNKKKLEEEKS